MLYKHILSGFFFLFKSCSYLSRVLGMGCCFLSLAQWRDRRILPLPFSHSLISVIFRTVLFQRKKLFLTRNKQRNKGSFASPRHSLSQQHCGVMNTASNSCFSSQLCSLPLWIPDTRMFQNAYKLLFSQKIFVHKDWSDLLDYPN